MTRARPDELTADDLAIEYGKAQYILSQRDVSEDQPEAAMSRLGLVMLGGE